MDAPTTCPCCGVVVMPPEMSYDFDGETVASLTREVAYLRATVARLRGVARPTVLPLPRTGRAVDTAADTVVETEAVSA
ncbi:hypothetical protein [Actinomycetospora straminea]|nr:hypothetical protein [Actinomycetospora straminea]MDD7936490.1 hypothetical protein [Actinomycetospora straminea]